MLSLKNIIKDYPVGDGVVHALKGVDVEFRKNEFVAILGQSGCGKTTLLNIIGGLDRYTSGDLIINGRSTKEFKTGIGTHTEIILSDLCSKTTTLSPIRRFFPMSNLH